MDPELVIDLPPECRRLLSTLAEFSPLGRTESDVAAYLITRQLDDMLRDGVIRLEHHVHKRP
jgi:hypothetical protein